MRLLVVTQVVDTEDPVLGFFHGWLASLAPRYEAIEVICLKEGKHALPKNVRVHSLGKEQGRRSRFAYAVTFLSLVWKQRANYDAVFVHMNQEYILLAGWLFALLGKRIYFWRNHFAGSFLTDLAALFSTKVFCTSTKSYTAQYGKTVIMPVGVATERFFPDAAVKRIPGSILFLSRMARAKRPELLVDALALLKKEGQSFTATFVGSPLPQDEAYYASLTKRAQDAGLTGFVNFRSGVANAEAADLYRSHEFFVNASPSGMFDKTILEAAACGALPLAVSEDWQRLAGKRLGFEPEVASLKERLHELLAAPENEREALREELRAEVVPAHSLSSLAERIEQELKVSSARGTV